MPASVTPTDRTPRKLAPEDAVALLMQGRRFELRSVADQGGCPAPSTWAKHKVWGWQFVNALWQVLDGAREPASLARLAKNAPTRYQADACEVVRGAVAYVEQRTTAATNRFQPASRSGPVDRAWMHAQRAHCLLEANDYDGAKEAADTALACLQGQAGDRTIGVIRAAATTALYTAAAAEGPNEAAHASWRIARAAQENVSSQWRNSVVSDALGDDLRKRFEKWGGTNVRTFGGQGNAAVRDLTAAAWSAAFGGTWGAWRQLATQAAVVSLTTSTDPDEVQEALTALTRTGAKKEAKTASTWLWLNGPVAALQTAVCELVTTPWSLRTEGPAMEIVAAAGDLLTPTAADKTIDRIFNTMRSKGPVRRLGGGWTYRWSEAEKALPRLLTAASATGHEHCAQVVIEVLGTPDSSADSVTKLATALRLDDLEPETIDQLIDVATARDDQYRVKLLEKLARTSPKARNELTKLATGGEHAAARALLVIGATTDDNWAAVGREAAAAVTTMVENAQGKPQQDTAPSKETKKARSYAFGGAPVLHDLALAAFHTRNFHHWKIVTHALESGVLIGDQMADCVAFLAANYQELPPTIQQRLKKASATLKAVEHALFDHDEFDASLFALRLATGHLNEGETLAGLLETRQSAGVQFARYVGSLPTSDRHAFLLACTVDQDPQVRAQAGYGVVSLAKQEPKRAKALATALLKSLELNDGCRMPIGIASSLKQHHPKDFEHVRERLLNHPSAAVRNQLT